MADNLNRNVLRLLSAKDVECEFLGLLGDAFIPGEMPDSDGWVLCGLLGSSSPNPLARFNIQTGDYEVLSTEEKFDLVVATANFGTIGLESEDEARRYLHAKYKRPDPPAPKHSSVNVLLQSALKYAELGYSVFPCAPNGKHPITSSGLHDATTDSGQIRRWWSANPSANIGLRTDGLAVIDIDGEDNPWPPKEFSSDLACAPTAKTPRSGRHHFFRQPVGAKLRNTSSKIAAHVDSRSNGGYVVVSPSINSGGSYQWEPGAELSISMDKLPVVPEWIIEKITSTQRRSNSRALIPSVSSPVVDNHSSGIPLTIIEGGRNSSLASLGGGMRAKGMSEPSILAALLAENQARCRPPLGEDEVRRIAASVSRYPANPWFIESDGGIAPSGEPCIIVNEKEEPQTAKKTRDPGPIPRSLLKVPGFISEVMDHTLSTAPYPDPVLAFAGALSLQAFLSGRKVKDDKNNRTSIYVLALAGSGTGKEHPRKVNQQILFESGMGDSLGDTFASGEGIEDRILATPNVLYQTDEIDGLMLKIKEGKESRYEGIMTTLLKIYSQANGIYGIRDKSGKPGEKIHQPNVVLFGTAVPKHFFGSLSLKMLDNGFFARMLVLEAGRRGFGNECVSRPPPPQLIDTATWWRSLGDRGISDMSIGADAPNPLGVPTDDDAAEILRAFRTQADINVAEAEDRQDDAAQSMWARAYEKALRLALIYACSRDRFDLLVTPEAATWACELSNHQTDWMLSRSAECVSESPFDARCKDVLASLKAWDAKHPGEFMPFWRLSRQHRWTEKEHFDVRVSLLSRNQIDYAEQSTGGTPKRCYRLRKG